MDSTLFVLWAMVGAMSLTLAAVHGLVWLLDRRNVAHLAFSIAALSVAAITRIEYGMMHSGTPGEYAQWIRLFHMPHFFLLASLVIFVRLQFGTDRRWLGWTVIALRGVVTIGNVLGGAGTTWKITLLERMPLLGERVAASAHGDVRPLQWIATSA